MVSDELRDGFVLFQDLREPGFSRILTVMKTLDLLSENQTDLQTLISNGLTAKVICNSAKPTLTLCFWL